MPELSSGQRLARLAASLAPGIFMIGYVIGTGSVTSMASAGASYGMSLTWTLVLASLFNHIMIVGLSRLTILTGETTLFTFRKHFGAPVTAFIMLALIATQLSSIVGVMAIASDVFREWTGQLFGFEVSPVATAVTVTALLLGLYWVGRHGFFLKVLASLVALMGVAFLFTALRVAPGPGEAIAGLVPRIPEVGNPQLLIAGMVGTTMASVVLITRSVLVQEKGWTIGDYPLAVRDSGVSNALLLVLNAAIMACAAGTLFVEGQPVTQAIDMVRTLEPIAGPLAVGGFVLGILAAALSSLFPNYLLGPWLVADFSGSRREMTKPLFRAMVVGAALFGLIVPVFGGRPVPLMIASQAVSPLIMPLMAVFVWILLNKREVAGEHRPSGALNVGMAITVVFCLYALSLAVRGFLAAM